MRRCWSGGMPGEGEHTWATREARWTRHRLATTVYRQHPGMWRRLAGCLARAERLEAALRMAPSFLVLSLFSLVRLTLLVLDLRLHIVDGIRRLHLGQGERRGHGGKVCAMQRRCNQPQRSLDQPQRSPTSRVIVLPVRVFTKICVEGGERNAHASGRRLHSPAGTPASASLRRTCIVTNAPLGGAREGGGRTATRYNPLVHTVRTLNNIDPHGPSRRRATCAGSRMHNNYLVQKKQYLTLNILSVWLCSLLLGSLALQNQTCMRQSFPGYEGQGVMCAYDEV
jgi:hypothetical protein